MKKNLFRRIIAKSHLRKLLMIMSGNEVLLERQSMLMDVYIPASVMHSRVFAKYRNINSGKDVVIVAGGPSMEKYVPIENAIHIAVNLAVNRKDIAYDYFFANDYSTCNEGELYDKNRNIKSMISFFGIGPYENIGSAYSQLRDENNIEFYFFDDCLRYSMSWVHDLDVGKYTFPINLEVSPLKVYGTTMHAALQFALWTNPKRIYLVGADCTSNGHAEGLGYHKLKGSAQDDFSRLLLGWKKIADYIKNYYPQIEIVSVNPVGLKGLFKDIYT